MDNFPLTKTIRNGVEFAMLPYSKLTRDELMLIDSPECSADDEAIIFPLGGSNDEIVTALIFKELDRRMVIIQNHR